MNPYTAFDRTNPLQFLAFREDHFAKLGRDFTTFLCQHKLPFQWSLHELHRHNEQLFWRFMDQHHHLASENDLDIVYALHLDGVSYSTILRHMDKHDCDHYKHLDGQFQSSTLGAMVLRLPFVDKTRCFGALKTLLAEVDNYSYADSGLEEHRLRHFLKDRFLDSLRGRPVARDSNFNTWLPPEEMRNLLNCDGIIDQRLAQQSIAALVARQGKFERMRDYHPLNTDSALPNPTGHEVLMQILIAALVYDKAVVMTLEGVDRHDTWKVTHAMSEVLADHIASSPADALKLAHQMTVNALSIFEHGLTKRVDRQNVYGGLCESQPYSRLEHLIYAGPLQAHRLDPYMSFEISETIESCLDTMAQFYGGLQPSELLQSHLLQVPALGDIASIRRITGIEDHIDTLSDTAFLHLREEVASVSQREAFEKILVRSSLLLMDYEQTSNRQLPSAGYYFRPANADQERLMIEALCAKGSPSQALLDKCNISIEVVREYLDVLSDTVKEQTLLEDLGL